MPIYEFACQDCGHEFEKIQSFSDSSTPTCPNCQGVHVQRRLSAPAIHFKGSGWYINDSKSAGKTGASGKNGETGSKSETGDEKTATESGAKTDAGTEAKSEVKADSAESKKAESKPSAKVEA
jgi:putative FmdB family regulatory protein